jgi:hypothetical protein
MTMNVGMVVLIFEDCSVIAARGFGAYIPCLCARVSICAASVVWLRLSNSRESSIAMAILEFLSQAPAG